MANLSTNVLVIGKSGVGKSSLLNYLFKKQIQETGTGEPVTEKGIFPFDYQYNDSFKICIYDTWGLEPDNIRDWKKLIMDEVEEHDKQHVSEWFNTIIFCLSANSDRVEDFEADIIKALVKENNQMVIVITHCQNENDERSIIMKKRVLALTCVKDNQVVFVSNVEKKLIGKKVTKFGREKIFTVIVRNLWDSLKVKVPYNIKKQLIDNFDSKKKEFETEINKKWLLFQRDKNLTEFEKKVNNDFATFLSNEMDDINKKFSEAMDYYNELSLQYAEIGLLDKEKIMSNPTVHFDALKEFKSEVETQVSIIREKLGDIITLLKSDVSKQVLKEFGVAIKKYFSSSKEIKETLIKTINDYMKNTRGMMISQIETVQKQLELVNVERIGDIIRGRDNYGKDPSERFDDWQVWCWKKFFIKLYLWCKCRKNWDRRTVY